jgi:hypothetical protein
MMALNHRPGPDPDPGPQPPPPPDPGERHDPPPSGTLPEDDDGLHGDLPRHHHERT